MPSPTGSPRVTPANIPDRYGVGPTVEMHQALPELRARRDALQSEVDRLELLGNGPADYRRAMLLRPRLVEMGRMVHACEMVFRDFEDEGFAEYMARRDTLEGPVAAAPRSRPASPPTSRVPAAPTDDEMQTDWQVSDLPRMRALLADMIRALGEGEAGLLLDTDSDLLLFHVQELRGHVVEMRRDISKLERMSVAPRRVG